MTFKDCSADHEPAGLFSDSAARENGPAVGGAERNLMSTFEPAAGLARRQCGGRPIQKRHGAVALALDFTRMIAAHPGLVGGLDQSRAARAIATTIGKGLHDFSPRNNMAGHVTGNDPIAHSLPNTRRDLVSSVTGSFRRTRLVGMMLDPRAR